MKTVDLIISTLNLVWIWKVKSWAVM